MAGIYIHIPFCRQKCHYCNFFSVASLKNKNSFLEALIREINLQKDYFDGESIETIYFGGGTPSLLSGDEINRIIEELTKHYTIVQLPEITMEANPDDLSKEKLADLKKTPVNRLSIGVQSFLDQDLQYLHRIHSGLDARNAILESLDHGFSNLSIDFIYGIPTLTAENWEQNLETFFSLNIPHLSAYALTVEPKTALDILISKNKMKPVLEDEVIIHFNRLIKFASNHGYTHYEISNFCREPFYSKHNVSYWSGKKYLGLGPSAHSFNGTSRQWNVSKITAYIQAVDNGEVPSDTEILSETQQYNEYILTSLRTMWGTDINFIKKQFGQRYSNHFLEQIAVYLRSSKVIAKDKSYCLTDEGKLFADGIASDLFL